MLARMTASALASVVFLKIHDFAHRPASEQARLRAQLESVVAVTAAELAPAARLVLDAPDGMAVAVLHDPRGALRLAERALSATAAGLPLCVGLNHGAVRLIVNGRTQAMAGDGIAVAATVAGFAGIGQLRTSRSFREALTDAAPGAEAALVPTAPANDASLRRHELFAFDPRAVARRRARYATLGAAAALCLVVAGIGVRVAEVGQERFVDGVMAKYRSTAATSERYVRAMAQKVRFQ